MRLITHSSFSSACATLPCSDVNRLSLSMIFSCASVVDWFSEVEVEEAGIAAAVASFGGEFPGFSSSSPLDELAYAPRPSML